MLQAATAMTAHEQWRDRPADERYQSLTDMLVAARLQRSQSVEQDGKVQSLRAESWAEGTVLLVNNAEPTHWAFGQLCARVGAPAGYLRKLSVDTTVRALNEGFTQAGNGYAMLRQLDDNAPIMLRALTSERYARVWNDTLIERCMTFEKAGFTLPMAYAGGVWGAPLVPSGAYLGDRDCFVFMVNDGYRIPDPTDPSGQGLGRGFILRNSEVGAACLTLDVFLFRYVCGNNIIWGFKSLAHFKRRHVGSGSNLFENWLDAVGTVVEYIGSDPTEDAQLVLNAASSTIESTKEDVLNKLAEIMVRPLAQKAWDSAEVQGLNPRSPWGIVNGLTRVSQLSPYQDEKRDIDLTASQVLARFVN